MVSSFVCFCTVLRVLFHLAFILGQGLIFFIYLTNYVILLNNSTLFCCFEMPPLDSEFLFILVFASRHSSLYMLLQQLQPMLLTFRDKELFVLLYLIPRVSEISQEAGLKVIFLYYFIWSHFHYESSKKSLTSLCFYRVPHIYPFNHFHEKHRLY